MIAVVLVVDKKTRKKKTVSFWCEGLSDANETIKQFRKVTAAKTKLIDLQPDNGTTTRK